MQLTVETDNSAHAAVVTVTLVNTITYSSQSFTATPTISFTIEVIDPCTITTFQDVTINPVT